MHQVFSIRLLLYKRILPALSLLLLPLVAMFMTEEVSWTLFDFIIAGMMLATAATIVDFILRKYSGSTSRLALFALLVLVFVLLWAEMAVGLFGTPLAGN